MSSHDPTETDPHLYRAVFENEHACSRISGSPGRPNSPPPAPGQRDVRGNRLHASYLGGCQECGRLAPGRGGTVAARPGAQGENTGTTETHVIFVELKRASDGGDGAPLGPSST